jgi:hypothetical protein
LIDVFFSIFFVTVVRSFSLGVGFKDRVVAAGGAALLTDSCGFFSRSGEAVAEAAAAPAARAETIRCAAARVESEILRAAARRLADVARAEPLLACVGLSVLAVFLAVADVGFDSSARWAVLAGAAELFGAARVRAIVFAEAAARVDSTRVFRITPADSDFATGLPRPALGFAAADALAAVLFAETAPAKFTLLELRLTAAALAGAATCFCCLSSTVPLAAFVLAFPLPAGAA